MSKGIHRLIYASRWSTGVADDLDEIVRRIITVSIHKNRLANVTGLLLVHDGWFVQALEGSSAAIDAIMARLQGDPRHEDVRVLASGPIDMRDFRDWNMTATIAGAAVEALLDDLGMLACFDGYGLDAAVATRLMIVLAEAERRRERRGATAAAA